MLQGDLKLVQEGKASLIIMESKRDLIDELRNLKVFAAGQPLENKLIVLDVEDVEYPIAINLLDIGFKTETNTKKEQRLKHSTTQSLISYFFNSLMEKSALSGQQDTVLKFLIEAMAELEQPNLDVLENATAKGGHSIIDPHLNKLDIDARNFFASKYKTDQYKKTREAIGRRIDGIKSNKTLRHIFRAKETKLDVYEAINNGHVILINASKAYLSDEMQVFGRFIVALVLSAIQRRQSLPKDQRLPTFFYIDEAHDMIANDTRILDILAQARSANVAMIIAHQWITQMSPDVRGALNKQCAIKCMGKLDQTEAKLVNANMGMSIDDITERPNYSWAISVKGGRSGIEHPADIDFKAQGVMNADERTAFDQKNRDIYAIQPETTRTKEQFHDQEDTGFDPNELP